MLKYLIFFVGLPLCWVVQCIYRSTFFVFCFFYFLVVYFLLLFWDEFVVFILLLRFVSMLPFWFTLFFIFTAFSRDKRIFSLFLLFLFFFYSASLFIEYVLSARLCITLANVMWIMTFEDEQNSIEICFLLSFLRFAFVYSCLSLIFFSW